VHSFSHNSKTFNKEVELTMGKDRQERKLRESRRVESDRDQSLQTHIKVKIKKRIKNII